MGPNSGGGRKNAGPANTAARARFSTWKPPVKGKGSAGDNDGDSRSSKKGVDVTRLVGAKGKVASSASAVSTRVRSSSGGLPPWIDVNALESISLSRELLVKLFRYMNFNAANTAGDGKENPNSGLSVISNPAKKVLAASVRDSLDAFKKSEEGLESDSDANIRELEQKIMRLKLSKEAKSKNNSQSDADSRNQKDEKAATLSHFQNLGFSSDEINHVCNVLHSDCEMKSADNESVFLVLLANISHQELPMSGNTTTNTINLQQQRRIAENNTDLTDECDVLKSIYSAAASTQMISILGGICSIIDLSLAESDLNIPGSIRSAEKSAEAALNIRFAIYRADLYPRAGSIALGWVSSPSEFMDPKTCRKCSVDAMNTIHSLHQGQACAFDFIQCVLSSTTASAEKKRKNLVLEKEEQQVAEYYERAAKKALAESNARKEAILKQTNQLADIATKAENDRRKFKSKADTQTNAQRQEQKHGPLALGLGPDDPPPIPVRKVLTMPEKKWTELPEYRSAYLQALNEGLGGTAARARTRDLLTNVLAESTMRAIVKEENKIEEYKNQSYDIEKLGVSGEIACTKTLMGSSGLSKSKAKALLQSTLMMLIERGQGYARDEESMKSKWVAESLKALKESQGGALSKQSVSSPSHSLIEENGRRGGVSDAVENGNDVEVGNSGGGSRGGDGRESVKVEAVEKKFSGGFSLEQCVAAVREKAREREEAAQNRMPDISTGANGDKAEELRRQQRSELESRRLTTDLENKRANKKYQDLLSVRTSLPAFQMRENIVNTILSNRVVVVSGDTGCGKTTQIPQLVLDAAIDMGRGAEINLVVTQPRRISAISVAERIAQERVETVGQTAGYHIKLESKKSAKTRILLMTTGVLLRRLQMEGDLRGISHVFVDEVHERDINTDFLLIVLKNLMKKRKDLKVVLMSATLNAELFSNYFKEEGCALISIPGRAFPVTTFFLEDALDHTAFKLDPKSDSVYKGGGRGDDRDPHAKKQAESNRVIALQTLRRNLAGKYSQQTLLTLENLDESVVNKELIMSLVAEILRDGKPGAILIFVPGLANIRDITELLKKSKEIAATGIALDSLRVLPLHSTLSSAEQSRVFTIYPPGVRKIVVSTNIAETSVTIPDVVFVLDTVKVKENRYDEVSQLSVLDECWVSQANARQRSGRAGRVQPGICYRLISSVGFNQLAAHTVPEMLRLSLEELILQILALDLGDPYEFLESAISPPESLSIRNALKFLDNLSAVVLDNDNDNEDDLPDTPPNKASKANRAEDSERLVSQITPLGFHLAALPINPRIGKLILFGVLLGCVDPMLTIAATVSAKSPFLAPFDDRERADQAKLKFSDGDSDLLAMLNAYEAWKKVSPNNSNTGRGGGGGGGGGGYQKRNPEEEIFCRVNYLSLNALQMIEQMRAQFLELLKDIGFLPWDVSINNVASRYENRNGSDRGMLGAVLCAGLAPNILHLPYVARSPASGMMVKKIAELGLNSKKGPVYVHPSSIMSERKSTNSSYMVYLEAMKTTKVYARDVTSVSPVALALFGGRLKIYEKHGVATLEGWLAFRVSVDLSKLLMSMRASVEEAFIEKVLSPQGDSSAEWRRAVDMLEALVLEGPPSDMQYVPPSTVQGPHTLGIRSHPSQESLTQGPVPTPSGTRSVHVPSSSSADKDRAAVRDPNDLSPNLNVPPIPPHLNSNNSNGNNNIYGNNKSSGSAGLESESKVHPFHSQRSGEGVSNNRNNNSDNNDNRDRDQEGRRNNQKPKNSTDDLNILSDQQADRSNANGNGRNRNHQERSHGNGDRGGGGGERVGGRGRGRRSN